MKVLVTGATGFTGSHVVPLLLERGFDVRCFVRRSSNRSPLEGMPVQWSVGDLEDRPSLERALDGVEALVNIASMGFGHAPTIVGAAETAGVRRAVFVSTTAIFTALNAPSKSVRRAAEDCVRNSDLDATILRPTMIYGSRDDRNMCRLVGYLKRRSVVPVPGNGRNLQQPVYVGDVAFAIVSALTSPNTIGRQYNISGKEPLTFDAVLDTIATRLGRRVTKIHFPATPVVAIMKLTELSGLRLPLKAEQVERLNEDKAFDHSAATRDFDYRPLSFAEGLGRLLESMSDRTPVRYTAGRAA